MGEDLTNSVLPERRTEVRKLTEAMKFERSTKGFMKWIGKWMVFICCLPALLFSSCAVQGGVGGGEVGVTTFDQQETRILNQARAVGAASGAAAGAVLARNSKIGSAGGAAIGLVAGLLAGEIAGRAQANNAKEIRLENDQLRELVAAAKANNDKLAASNRRVAQRIAELRKVGASERSQLAKAELGDVDATLKNVDEMNSSRRNMMASLPKSQANELSAEVRRGESERAKLASYRSELNKMSLASN